MELQQIRNLTGRLALLIASVAGMLLGVELLLEMRASTPGYAVWPPHLDETFNADPRVMPGVTGPSKFTTNSEGIRGDELDPSHEVRILAVGGSTTESLYLDDAEAWPHLLQEALEQRTGRRVWVGNVGRSGFNARFYRVIVEALVPQIRDLDVVLVLTGINDLAYRLRSGIDYRTMNLSEDVAARRMRQRAFHRRPRSDAPPFYRLPELRRRVLALARANAEKRPSFLFQDRNGAVYDRWRENRRLASSLRTELPDLISALAEYRRNLESIAALGRRHGVAVVLATQPVLWQAGLPQQVQDRFWFGGVGDFQKEVGLPYYSVEALADGIDRYNDVTRGVCERQRLACIDLAAQLPAHPNFFYDDCHFSEAGARQVARIVASSLRM